MAKQKLAPNKVNKKTSELDRILAQAALLHERNNFQEAIELYHKALSIRQSFPELHCNLGIAYYQIDKFDEAIACFRQATLLAPKLSRAYFFLGTVCSALGDFRQAVEALQQAVDLSPGDFQAQTNLAISLNQLGRADEAIAAHRRAIKLNPNVAKMHLDFGITLATKQRYEEAIAAFRQSIALDPFNADAHSNLGSSLQELSHSNTDESVACYREAIRLNPQLSHAHANLGTIIERYGDPEGAAEHFSKAVELTPTPTNLSQSVFNLNYCGSLSAEQVAIAHFRAGEIFDRQAAPFRLPPRARGTPARLRIGFISPDLRNHAVSFFLKPLLRHRDRAKVEIFCYADVVNPDLVSKQLQELSDHWLNAFGLTDDELAARIRADEIDFLVDLAGHCPINRLPVFARRPAPVQMTWLGYPNSTGLKSIDYRIVDAITDPVGEADSHASEKLLRLPAGFLCYEPSTQAPTPSLALTAKDGVITFGSFNTPSKMTPVTFDIWAKLLHRLPTARLLLKSNRLAIGPLRKHLLASFAERDIAADRLILLSGDADPYDHLIRYHDVDIALDPIFYNGTTTTCDSLWMGVPVISLRGDRHAARVGASLLTQLGLSSLIADNADHYIEIAVNLAQDPAKLAAVRQGLRERMAASPLCDGPAFARKFETALHQIWTGTLEDANAPETIGSPIVLKDAGTRMAPAEHDAAAVGGVMAERLSQVAAELARAAEQPNRVALSQLRDARNRLVLALLATPAVTSFDHAKFSAIDAALAQTGLKTAIEDHSEMQMLAQARLALGGEGDRVASALLAHCLLAPAHTLPVLPALTELPMAWICVVLRALFEEPIFWAATDEPARHLQFVERLTRSCVALLEGLTSEQKSGEFALLLANVGRFTSSYFADKSLKNLARDRAQLAEQCLTLLGVPVDHAFPPSARPALKLGCYRIHWQGNTEVAAMLAHLRGLDDRFDITLYSNHPLGDSPCEQAARALAGTLRILPDNLPASLAMIREDDLDIMLVGHNITAIASMPTFLYSCRLARFQVATTVCPSTTGLRSMDAFLNGAFNERSGAQGDYSEKLLLAPDSINLYDFHEDDSKDGQLFSRAALAIPEDRFLFVSGANAYKITAELLNSWAYILNRTENTQLLLYPFNPHWRDAYPRQEFERHIRKVMALEGIDPTRITILPPQPDRAHIRSILRLADLYLDSFPFSGAVSILDPIAAQLPMVLLQGDQARCRQSAGMHREFTLPAAVAHFVGEYENLAITLTTAPEKLAGLRAESAPCLARMRAGRLKIADLLYQSFQTRDQPR